MSKNIIIAKDGEAMTLRGVDTLRASAVGGGSVDWMPEDETQTGTIDIRANGTYKAEDKGLYAFSRATVNVPPNQVTGRGSDGNDYHVTVDDNGYLQREKVPSSIQITTPPTYTGPYGVGAIISFDGLVVTAYDADGESMGVIPTSELVFPVTQAPWEPSGDVEYESFSDLSTGGFSQPIPNAKTFHGTNGSHGEYETSESMSGDGRLTAYYTSSDRSRCYLVLASSNPEDKFGGIGNLTHNYTYNNKTVYYAEWTWSAYGRWDSISPYSGEIIGDRPIETVAWTMIYGNMTTSGGYQVPVQWNRPNDGKTLETSYGITVVAGPSGNDN